MAKDLRLNSFDDQQNYHGVSFDVINVADGDTIYIDWPDNVARRGRTRIRLLGVDAPELANNDRPEQPLAHEATVYLNDLLHKQKVTVRLDEENKVYRDKYNRLLAYVYLESTGKMINELLLERGLAWPDSRHEHSQQQQFIQISRNAYKNGKGIWGLDEPQIPAFINIEQITDI